jgi:hypothetical protein
VHELFNGLHMRPLANRLEVIVTDDHVDEDWQLKQIEATMGPYRDQLHQIDAEMVEALEDTQELRAPNPAAGREDA